MDASIRQVNLQRLILALAALSALVMLGNAVWAGYQVQRQQLIDKSLEANRVYARSLAQSSQHFVLNAQQQLAVGAERLSRNLAQPAAHDDEVERIKLQTDAFNSVISVNAQGVVVGSSPALPELQGKALTSAANRQALQQRLPMVSDPFISHTGNLVVTLSHPMFDEQGDYAGYITASIHLRDPNVLHSLLGTHPYDDGSYLYVVSRNGTVLYHPDPDHVGQPATRNAAVDALSQGSSGALHSHDHRGVHMLAGFAPLPAAGWGIIAQRPAEAAVAPTGRLLHTVLRNAAPLGVLTLLLIWLCSRRIASPLQELARHAQDRDVGSAIIHVKAVNSWYYEAAELKQAVLVSFRNLSERIGLLDQATLTDPLTQLLNRRGLERALSALNASGMPFGVITFDVDHFKDVNDRHGHDTGDQVLVGIAQRMCANARPQDVLCRLGGEEFLALLPEVGAETALQVAERLRSAIEAHAFPTVGHVTISAGVSHYPETQADADLAIRQADKALYRAKQSGRNRAVLYRRRGHRTAHPEG
ncbi:sensor domain-containing diguanylate cyclase [Stenotrophomonas sp. NPDC077659]|uniref:sensor domain-containing diguanylate cyclase n=1 Tax=Stenotrophomonas sp. NPDC077659 TaxID=3390694 RepID=UPI003D000A6E